MNRSFSIRSSKGGSSSGGGVGGHSSGRRGFSLKSLRGSIQQPELSKRLYKLIKSENNLVGAHETAGKERISIATQLSEWGEKTEDPSVSDLSDKLGVILAELGEQEDNYAHALEESRTLLKRIRNTERSVQPSRDNRTKIADEIARLKSKEPQSARLVILEQELVRAEAENLVAEAQLINVTRKSIKEAYDAELAATIERAEKQIILAGHGRRLLKLVSDEPVVPGDKLPPYHGAAAGRQILCDCEDDLRDWRPGYSFASVSATEDADAAVVRANTAHNTAHNNNNNNKSSSTARNSGSSRGGGSGGGGGGVSGGGSEEQRTSEITEGEETAATSSTVAVVGSPGGGGERTNAEAEGRRSSSLQLSASSGPQGTDNNIGGSPSPSISTSHMATTAAVVASPKSQTTTTTTTNTFVGSSPTTNGNNVGSKDLYQLPS